MKLAGLQLAIEMIVHRYFDVVASQDLVMGSIGKEAL